MSGSVRIAIICVGLAVLVFPGLNLSDLDQGQPTVLAKNAITISSSDFPEQAAYRHQFRFRVAEVTRLEETTEFNLMKLTVDRFYGKISTQGLERAREHETQRMTILFPAAKSANIQVGDIISYSVGGYLALSQ